MNRNFFRIAAASPKVFPGDVAGNAQNIARLVASASQKGIDAIIFPALSLTGCTAGDLMSRPDVLEAAHSAVERLSSTCPDGILAIVGLPARRNGRIFSSAAAISKGRFEILCAGDNGDAILNLDDGVKLGIVTGEDYASPSPAAGRLVLSGANIICNLGTQFETALSASYRRRMIESASSRFCAAYVYAGAGLGESPTDAAYAGHCIIAEDGETLAESGLFVREAAIVAADADVGYVEYARSRSQSWQEAQNRVADDVKEIDFPFPRKAKDDLIRPLERNPFVPADEALRERICAETFAIQTSALASRMEAIPCANVVIGLSGGLDSALALLVCAGAFERLGLDKSGIHAFTMPGFGTTRRTKGNAGALCKALGIALETVDIVPSCRRHLRDLGRGEEPHDTTYENAQARMRTLVLMDKANQTGGFVVGTGDLSELALGWCTFSGDHMSMFGVNAGVPKTLVREICSWYASRHPASAAPLKAILDTPISPELLPANADGSIAQVTEDRVGPYELHDFFLYHFVKRGAPKEKILCLALQAFAGSYDKATVEKWLGVFIRRFHSQQFKRNCMPDGPAAGPVSLSPRGGWTMPSDSRAL